MPVLAPPPLRPPAAAPEATAGSRRKLVFAGIGVLVLAGLLGCLLMFGGSGGSGDTAATVVPAPHRAATTPATAPTPSAAPVVPTLAPVDGNGDPFAPLPEESAAAAASPSAAPAATTATASSGSTGTSTVESGTTGVPVQLLTIKGASAQIQIDDKPYTVTKGAQPVSGYTVDLVASDKVQISRDGKAHTLILGELQTF